MRTDDDRVRGSMPGGGWHLVASDGADPLVSRVRSKDGGWLCREPHGFPGAVRLEGGGLVPADQLRLAKGVALAAAHHPRLSAMPLDVRILAAGERQAETAARVETSAGVCRISIPRPWLASHLNRRSTLRRALADLMDVGALSGDVDPQRSGSDLVAEAPRDAMAHVLVFRNVFTKDVDRGDARQVNPGAHHLISALRGDGHRVTLLDGKHPLQDVCVRPPAVDDPLAPDQVLTDPEELARALDTHPDLDLVCLTVLERSFAQVRELCRWIRDRSDAWIAIGGPMPTAAPEHCLVHLPEVDLLVRGDGEAILPRIARAVAGRRGTGTGASAALRALAGERGIAARAGDTLLCGHLDRINRVDDLDYSPLDFDVLEREHVQGGLSLTTSRGCVYACRFCSVHDRQLWRAMSAERVLDHLSAYRERLARIFGDAASVPRQALDLQLWDDDFFVDPRRAATLLRGIAAAGHRVSFLQGTVASFFVRDGRRITCELDEDLLDAIPPDLFTETGGLKLGTESFSDAELRRLGKPYDIARIRRLVEGLARRGIRQDHYLVLCNRDTSLDDLLSGLENIAELRWRAGEAFSVLQPSWLIHLFSTALHRSAQRRGFAGDLPDSGVLRVADRPEFDYPFVLPDRPRRREVFEVVRRFPAGMHFGAAGDPDGLYEGIYGEEDREYVRVFAAIRGTLEDRDAEVAAGEGPEAAAEGARIQRILGGRLAPGAEIPRGVVARLAPGLAAAAPTGAGTRVLGGYVDALLRSAIAAGIWTFDHRCVADADGALLRVALEEGPLEVRVVPRTPGVPSAAHTRNLAFVVVTPMADPEIAGVAGRVVGALVQALEPLDLGELR